MKQIYQIVHPLLISIFAKTIKKNHPQRFLKLVVLILVAGFLSACEKEEGEGGTSTIVGRVYAQNYNSDFTVKLGEYYAEGVDVYIIYGDEIVYSDDFETGLDGWYRFRFLNKGTYTIYAISKDPTRQSPSGEIAVSQTVTIKSNHSTVVADDLVIYK
ncbi:hypothetical protein [Gaoshiqia sp. Z1-71]|uniref:hypothetical protein n=1 Tax=Gaoshiqia hydrogeniformans TaxID=3290090 RepID=UPI003BF78EDC